MDPAHDSPVQTRSRRSLLGALGSASTLLVSGCLQEARSALNRDPAEQIRLTIKTVPADRDRHAVEIARTLRANLVQVGIDAEVVLMREDELRRDVLINRDFDLYVDRSPEIYDPDVLHSLLHSKVSGDPGWLNPFGLARIQVDELLEAQRTQRGADRRSTVFELLRAIASLQPFAVIGFPEEIRTARTDRFEKWSSHPLRDPLGFLTLEPVSREGESASQLRLVITDDRVTKNFNPIAVEYRNRGTFTGLVYDSLGRRYGEAIIPWLAREWRWEETPSGFSAEILLREGLTFHDGEDLTADDVGFTFRFLADTALGEMETAVPAPRFQGRISLLDDVEVLDGRTLRVGFGETSPEVARRAFTVPIFPAHVWEPRAREVDLAGFTPFEGITEALVWQNPEPVGSGVLRFERRVPEEMLALRRFDDHFLHRDSDEVVPSPFAGGLSFEEMRAIVAPSSGPAVELVAAGEADATLSGIDPSVVPRVGREDHLKLLVDRARSFYHVGFNTQRSVLGNTRFRRLLARLLDPASIATGVFDGYFDPSAVPLRDSSWIPSDLEWAGSDPEVPFIGSAGTLDGERARTLFREAGYRYNEKGHLLP